MDICQVNKELGLPNALFVNRILEVLKTRMEDLVALLNYRSIARRSVGRYAQPYMLIVRIVARNLKPLQARINNTAIWFVVTKDIVTKKLKNVVLGRVIKQAIQQNINGLLQNIPNLNTVMTAGVVGYLLNGLIYLVNTIENVMTGVTYAKSATLNMIKIDTQTSSGTKYTDVIRKRYAKFIEPETWEDRWQKLTPAV